MLFNNNQNLYCYCQEKLIQRGYIDIDPATRTTIPVPTSPLSAATAAGASYRSSGAAAAVAAALSMHSAGNALSVQATPNNSNPNQQQQQYEEGPMLQIESEHPYRNNTNEYTTVSVPGAVSYVITFHEDTKTEMIYDYVKFYDNDTHTDYFGCGKYSGGTNGSSCNWPGVGNRPPLVIPASKFIIHFKTNGTVNDWGFCMRIVPTLHSDPQVRLSAI